ncbi:dihydrolipoamide acetyltransferase family protein [Microbacterium sp. ZW T5_45]|uniref:dihydrolipoamide acetyltransferase family protein n=1 Tax=Microbacterium sp. ZW T5_45 TaxID=3378080 RepID=UPI003851D1CA
MIAEFRLPDLGEGLTEAEVVQWLVAPGDPVALNQTLAEVETAKAVVELPSPYAGTVRALHAEAGETVAVGAPLIAFDVAGADDGSVRRTDAVPTAAAAKAVSDVAAPPADDGAARNEDTPQPNLVGYGAAASAAGRPARRARRRSGVGVGAAETAVLEAAVRDAAPHDARPTATLDLDVERPRSTPPVRAHAKRLGVDLTLVAASVGDRRITRDDVDAFAERIGISAHVPDATSPVPSFVEPDRRETRIPVRGVRKHTAVAMAQSAFTAPHVTVFHTVDVTATMELLESLRADPSLRDHRIGPLAVVAKAVCLALAATPELNSRWDDAAGEIIRFGYVDLGIAAATERGLVVPNIREAQALTLVELSDRIRSLAQTAREGRSTPADLAGGTFSISNIGVFGVDAGTPILPPGQGGILAIGAIRRQPWEHRGEIALRDVMTLSLSFDHRIVDGAEGARFVRSVAGVLEQPGRAMLLS